MIISIKWKKSQEAAGFGIVLGIAALLLAAAILFYVLKSQTSKFDEQLQVNLCRISNEVKFGLKEKTGGVISSPQICHTLDKNSDKNNQLPTVKYKQSAEGAEKEITNMVKDCWYMWLEGSEANTFDKYPLTEGCFTCYTFKIRDNVNGVSFSSLSNSMSKPYFASDRSDKCSPSGGFLKSDCAADEKQVGGTLEKDKKCCVKKETNDECENRGGACSAFNMQDRTIYDKWSCPKRDQSCYVKNIDVYSYTDYIRRFGKRGGELLFIPPSDGQTSDISYVPQEIYAISFISPNKVFCANVKGLDSCFASIGEHWYVPVAVAGTAAGGLVLGGTGLAASAGTAVPSILSLATRHLVTTAAGVGLTIYYAEDILKSGLNLLTSPIATEVPNFIIISTKNHAEDIGCTINY